MTFDLIPTADAEPDTYGVILYGIDRPTHVAIRRSTLADLAQSEVMAVFEPVDAVRFATALLNAVTELSDITATRGIEGLA